MKRKFATGWLCLFGVPALAIELPHSAPPAPPPPPPAGNPAPGSAPVPAPRPEPVEEDASAPSPAPAVKRAYLGVGGSQLPGLLSQHLRLEDGVGVVVRALDPEGPAAKGGLAEDDVITRVSGRDVGDQEELRGIVQSHQPGEEIEIEYIHRGETKTMKVVLAEDFREGPAIAGGRPQPLDQLMLEGMPHDQAQRIREAVERNLRAFENFDRDGFPGDDPAFDMAREMQERMGRMFQRGGGIDIGALGGPGPNVRSTSTIRMMDENGSIELRSENGEKQVRAYDRAGELEWEGPLDDERNPMPDDIRERVDRLNIDMDFKGNGLRLRMRQR